MTSAWSVVLVLSALAAVATAYSVRLSKAIDGNAAADGAFVLDTFAVRPAPAGAPYAALLNVTALSALNDLSATGLHVFSDDAWPVANVTSCWQLGQQAKQSFSLSHIHRAIANTGYARGSAVVMFPCILTHVVCVCFVCVRGCSSSWTLKFQQKTKEITWLLVVSECLSGSLNQFVFDATLQTSA